jgi:hypothetical protein
MLPEDHAKAIARTLAKTQHRHLSARWAYFVGDHPRIYVTPKMREAFKDIADSLVENYCGIAVNARIQRLEVTGWDGGGAEAAQRVWEDGGFPQRQDVMFRWGLVHGGCNLIVQDGIITANSAALSYAEPDPDDWLGVSWAGKAFLSDEEEWHVTLWDETSIYRYTGPKAIRKNLDGEDKGFVTIPQGTDFHLDEDEPGTVEAHGYDRVPVFPVNPYGYMAPPLIDQISPIQDRINKITANKFVAAEFGAFKQRVFFTRQDVDAYSLRQQPDTAIILDPGDSEGRASVQELQATDLKNYDDAKNAEVDALFTIASLPRHMRVNPGAVPSGEAIKADEGPFVEALRDHQREYGEAFVSALQLIGIDAEPVWRDIEPHDDLINAQVVKTLVDAGLPWQKVASMFLGMSEEDIADAQDVTDEADAKKQDLITAQTNAMLSNPTLQTPPNPKVAAQQGKPLPPAMKARAEAMKAKG